MKLECEKWPPFRDLMKLGIFSMIQLKGLCIVSEMPTEVRRESMENTRLHSTESPAVKFADGYEVYRLWGVRFEKDIFDKVTSGQMPAKEVVNLENIEQRMAALRLLGAEKILSDLDSRLEHEEGGYQLYSVHNMTQRVEYALKYKCPTTAREYVSFVRPEVGEKKDAIHAIASKWSMTKEQYLNLAGHA